MATIYITSNNGKLSKKASALVFTDYDGTTTTLPIHTVSQLFIIGSIQLTGPALHLLMTHSIETVFVSKNGRYDGKLVFDDSKNVFLRQRQFEVLHDQRFCLEFARSIVSGKVKNQYLFMQRIARKTEKNAAVNELTRKVGEILKKIDLASSIDEIRGHEGYVATLYFNALGRNINQSWTTFKGRNKNPPRDEVNAVLSFLYTLLSYRIDSLILAEGLDNGVGILHHLAYGRKSLVFDLMEEFRTPIVDTLTCALFNMGTLRKEDFLVVHDTETEFSQSDSTESDDFDTKLPGPYEQAVLLTKEGLKKVVTQFERKLQEEHRYEALGKRLEYKAILHEQVKMFKRHLMGLEETYKPIVVV